MGREIEARIREEGRRVTRWAGILVLSVLALALATGSALGQEENDEAFDLAGVVTNDSGQPLVGALVMFAGSDLGTLTDTEGRFRLPDVLPGRVELTLEQLGYADRRWQGVVGPETGSLLIRMEPQAVMLEGLEVVADRFESRRRAYPYSSRSWDRDVVATSPYDSMMQFVQGRGGLFLTDCRGRTSFSSTCIWYRGRPVAPRIYVDEAPVFAGMEYLDMIQPWEVHMVEIYRRGTEIRIYTQHFMERAAKTRLQPIAFR